MFEDMFCDDTPCCLCKEIDQSPDIEIIDPDTIFFFTDDTPTCKD